MLTRPSLHCGFKVALLGTEGQRRVYEAARRRALAAAAALDELDGAVAPCGGDAPSVRGSSDNGEAWAEGSIKRV